MRRESLRPDFAAGAISPYLYECISVYFELCEKEKYGRWNEKGKGLAEDSSTFLSFVNISYRSDASFSVLRLTATLMLSPRPGSTLEVLSLRGFNDLSISVQ